MTVPLSRALTPHAVRQADQTLSLTAAATVAAAAAAPLPVSQNSWQGV